MTDARHFLQTHDERMRVWHPVRIDAAFIGHTGMFVNAFRAVALTITNQPVDILTLSLRCPCAFAATSGRVLVRSVDTARELLAEPRDAWPAAG